MNNKNLLITGGLGGIGFDIVNFFVKKKFNIIIADNLSRNNLNLLIHRYNIHKYQKNIFYHKLDLTKSNKIKFLFNLIKKKYFFIDVLINCAGIQHISPLENFSNKKWEEVLSINLSSNFYTSKYVIPLMKKNKWGRIINIVSTHGHVASINKSGYIASKHGLIGLTKSIALETAKLPITCNAICPGWVNTPLVQKQIYQRMKKNNSTRKNEEMSLLSEKQPNLSFIKGKDIAAVAFFLCSDEAKDITGSSINIDGGWTSQ